MKSSHFTPTGIATFIFFPLAFIFLRTRKKVVYAITFLLVITLSSCYLNFFRTGTRPSMDAATMSRLNSENKYFIVHFANSTNGLENVYLSGDSVYGKIVPLPVQHSKYLYPNSSSQKNRVKHADKPNALIEVHLYTNLERKNADSLFSAPRSSFNRADVYELNRSATKSNHILSTVGVIATVGLIVGTIAAIAAASAVANTAEGCNCPQVYINNNNGEYSFASGLYSGAVYSTLERMDYLPLSAVAADAENISFKIANAKDEEQFINQVQLLQVNHLQNTNVLQDRHGNVFSYANTEPPSTASAIENDDIKNLIQQTDGKYYSFDNGANKNGFSDLVLNFNNPTHADKAKLIIHARNTQWGGLLHKEFINLFGDNFEKWREKQEKADPVKLQKWQTDQELPLMVYIKTTTGWKFVDYFPLIGNTASRDMIMEITTADITQSKMEIKLETAYRFWDVDFAGIDYSTSEELTINIIEPLHANKTDGTDQKEVLSGVDKQYTHLVNEEAISFDYQVAPATGNTVSTYFLISGGYYHSLEHITGKTNYGELYKFRKKGAFDKFSREKYQEVQDLIAMKKK